MHDIEHTDLADEPSVDAVVSEAAACPPEYLVGIGASAGGLEALERLFSKMPVETGLSFVVVQHLSPDFESHMDDLLRRVTDIPVHLVEDGVEVEPNTIYLIPAKKEMIVSDRRLLLTDKDPEGGLTMPIDSFLRSLAQDVGRQAIGIVLSGTGSDGTRGVEHVKNAGGLVIVQSPETAKFDGMPSSAIRTGAVDLELPPESMPETLAQYAAGELTPERLREQEVVVPIDDHMERILHVLRRDYGIDFSHYKPPTVVRRTERRVGLGDVADLAEYAERIETDADERDVLYRDLLIGVTEFFRDPDPFEKFETEIVPEIVSSVRDGDELRVWVAGCATGEEAYSVAMAFHDHMHLTGRSPDLKIFATDVHKGSLDTASAGVYEADRLAGVSDARRERYFERVPGGFRVNTELRKSIVFAPHNVVSDAPFTKLQLVTCRNLLIYLQPATQKKVLSLFHFALRKGGYLFLGSSESPGELEEEFARIDGPSRLYKKRRDVKLPPDTRFPLSTVPAVRPRSTALPSWSRDVNEGGLFRVYDAMLSRAVNAGLLLDDEQRLVHSFGGAERYLRVRGGRPPENALQMLDDELRTAVTGAIQHARKDGGPVRYTGVHASNGDGREEVTVVVEPIVVGSDRPRYTLVSLEPARTAGASVDAAEYDVDEIARDRIADLEGELRFARENLQATIEELETSNEELQATNQELVASNEEMQSTNEELHSVNEELYTVNAEHQRKITELTAMTEDFDNLLESTDVGVIFLDDHLRIRKFTPNVEQTFHLLPMDIGRPIDGFAHSFDAPDLMQDARTVLRNGRPIRKEVRDADGNPFLLRLLPFRGTNQGVVLTFIDVSDLRTAEEERSAAEQKYRDLYENAPDMYVSIDAESRTVVDCNRTICTALELDRGEIVGRSMSDLYAEESRPNANEAFERLMRDGETSADDLVLESASGRRIEVSLRATAIRNDAGEIVRTRSVLRDVTEAKRKDRLLRRSDARNGAVLQSALDAIVTMDADGRIVEFNPAAERIFGYTTEEAIGDRLRDLLIPERMHADFDTGLARLHETGEGVVLEGRNYLDARRADGTEFPIELTVAKIDVGGPPMFTGFVRDLTEQRRAEATARRLEEKFAATVRNAAVGIAHVDLDDNWILVNDRLCEITGHDRESLLALSLREITHPDDVDLAPRAIDELLSGTREHVALEKRYLRPDGSPVWVSKTMSLQRDENGVPRYVIAIVEDVSERVRYEQELREAVRARESFLAMLSHELRNPLSAIVNAARLMKRGNARLTGFSPHDAASVVERQSEQMNRLLRDLLDVSRISSGKLRIEVDQVDLVDVVREVRETMRPRLADRDVNLDVETPDEPVVVRGDATRLQQVVGNLVSNAVKYSPRESRVDLVLNAVGREAVLRVRDRGRGIADEDLERIFDPFVRLDESDGVPETDGLGVGLALVRSLVANHGGRVEAHSRGRHRGSEFVVRLPLERSEDLVVPEEEPPQTTEPSAPLRIVIVEDVADNAEMLRQHLELDGHTVRVATDGTSGIDLVADWQPDVVVTDIGLPDMDGYDVARGIRQRLADRTPRLVALTGYGQPADLDRAREAGFDQHLTKPLDMATLAAALHADAD